MINVVGANKSFGSNHVLKDVSIDFEKGKTNLIIGKSGSGKTVLLKSIVALYPLDSGSVYYGDTDITKLDSKKLKKLRKDIGMLFQGGALFDSKTVLENIMFPMDMFSQMSNKEKLKRAQFCLDRVNLVGADNLYPSEISGGMNKRVAIARAIALNPSFLFCDEPNSGLDPTTALLIDNLISEITKEYQITTIINTHDMNSVINIGDNVTFIDKGEVAWRGDKYNIFDSKNQHLQDFISPAMLIRSINR